MARRQGITAVPSPSPCHHELRSRPVPLGFAPNAQLLHVPTPCSSVW